MLAWMGIYTHVLYTFDLAGSCPVPILVHVDAALECQLSIYFVKTSTAFQSALTHPSIHTSFFSEHDQNCCY
jgi:hypothetical protein